MQVNLLLRMRTTKILLAPLQGFTDYWYRNAHSKILGGVDEYYAPYLRLDNDKSLPKRQLKDIHPDNNTAKVLPQILVNNADDFIYLANLLSDLGYSELNLNLGCPYPMVTNRLLGSGLLNKPEIIERMLEQSLSKIKIKVSIKLRLGLDEASEIYTILPLLNQFDLTKVIIHPRIARKLYKGNADVDAFAQCLPLTKHKLVYNGDIIDIDSFKQMEAHVGHCSELMIGRGILCDVFLGRKINNENVPSGEDRIEVLKDFHQAIFEDIKQSTSGFSHTQNKLLHFWTYFAYNFENSKKIIKVVKKSRTEATYLTQIESIFCQ